MELFTKEGAVIFGNLEAHRLEVLGAVLGTLIARFFEFSCIMGYFLSGKSIFSCTCLN